MRINNNNKMEMVVWICDLSGCGMKWSEWSVELAWSLVL